MLQQAQLVGFKGHAFSRRYLAINPFQRVAVDHHLLIEGAEAAQGLSKTIHLMRFEKTFGIEELLFQREQLGRDFGRRNNANSRWVPVVQVNGGMFPLVAYLIELTPKARASVQQDRLYVFAGTQRVYAVVRASAVIVKEAHATESDAVQTLARWRKNLIVPEHG